MSPRDLTGRAAPPPVSAIVIIMPRRREAGGLGYLLIPAWQRRRPPRTISVRSVRAATFARCRRRRRHSLGRQTVVAVNAGEVPVPRRTAVARAITRDCDPRRRVIDCETPARAERTAAAPPPPARVRTCHQRKHDSFLVICRR